MINYCTNYPVSVPDLTVYMNCDTCIAINLRSFNITEHDELIFTIKNFDYINSPYVFLFRAHKSDMDDNGEVIFKITSDISKKLKHDAFYNISMLVNKFDFTCETSYKKLTDNGNIIIEHGAHDLDSLIAASNETDNEIIGMRLECIDQI